MGQTISRYRILSKIGGVRMWVVYKPEDISLHRFVALKFLPDDVAKDSQALAHFQREEQAACPDAQIQTELAYQGCKRSENKTGI